MVPDKLDILYGEKRVGNILNDKRSSFNRSMMFDYTIFILKKILCIKLIIE